MVPLFIGCCSVVPEKNVSPNYPWFPQGVEDRCMYYIISCNKSSHRFAEKETWLCNTYNCWWISNSASPKKLRYSKQSIPFRHWISPGGGFKHFLFHPLFPHIFSISEKAFKISHCFFQLFNWFLKKTHPPI